MRPEPSGRPAGWRRGAVAQMGERCNRTAEVRGSIPLSSTSLFNDLGWSVPAPYGKSTENISTQSSGVPDSNVPRASWFSREDGIADTAV